MKRRAMMTRLFLLMSFHCTAAWVPAAAFSGIFAFGDSLTDTGNTNLASGGASPGAGYYAGRYSNGPVWVEQMAGYLGMAAPVSSLTGGRNYAFGGAYTLSGGSVPTLTQQAGMFMGGVGTFQATDLVVVWGGANDFLLGGQTNPVIPANNVLGVISTLAGAGARNILVPNLPDLGDTPALQSTGNPLQIAGASQLTLGFNATLKAGLDNLKETLGINLWQLDVYGIGKELKNHPADYGITNITDPALLTGNAANAGGYLYWDGVHPTARVHDIFGDAAARLVPEPGSVVLVVMTGGLICLRRVRTRGEQVRS